MSKHTKQIFEGLITSAKQPEAELALEKLLKHLFEPAVSADHAFATSDYSTVYISYPNDTSDSKHPVTDPRKYINISGWDFFMQMPELIHTRIEYTILYL